MKGTLQTLSIMSLLSLMAGCTSTNSPKQLAENMIYREDIATSTMQNYPAKKAQNIALYSYQHPPKKAYKVIGVASVYDKNILGMKRDKQTIRSMMKELAARIGGDGLIDFIKQNDKVQASVIAYQNA